MFERSPHLHTFYEFFAGSGMVRAGLGGSWECTFANDCDARKAATIRQGFGNGAGRWRDEP